MKKVEKIIASLEEKHIVSYCTLINLILIFVVIVVKDSQKELIDILTILVLFLTFIAIVYYTFETYKLRKVTEKQMRINILPIISLKSINGEIVEVANIGKSPSLNVIIDNVKNRECLIGDHKKSEKYDFSFDRVIPFLNIEKEEHLKIKVIPPNTGHQTPNSDPFLNPMNPNFLGKYELKINYEDIEHKKIHTVFEVSKNRITFKEIRCNS